MPKDPVSQMRTLGLKVPATLQTRLSKAVLSHLRATLLLAAPQRPLSATRKGPHHPLLPSRPRPAQQPPGSSNAELGRFQCGWLGPLWPVGLSPVLPCWSRYLSCLWQEAACPIHVLTKEIGSKEIGWLGHKALEGKFDSCSTLPSFSLSPASSASLCPFDEIKD